MVDAGVVCAMRVVRQDPHRPNEGRDERDRQAAVRDGGAQRLRRTAPLGRCKSPGGRRFIRRNRSAAASGSRFLHDFSNLARVLDRPHEAMRQRLGVLGPDFVGLSPQARDAPARSDREAAPAAPRPACGSPRPVGSTTKNVAEKTVSLTMRGRRSRAAAGRRARRRSCR